MSGTAEPLKLVLADGSTFSVLIDQAGVHTVYTDRAGTSRSGECGLAEFVTFSAEVLRRHAS